MSDKKIIVAIDGFSSTGKSTMAKHLAATVGYRYIDSGAMYRAVTLYAINDGNADVANHNVDTEAIVASLPKISIDFRVNGDGTQNTILNGNDVEHEIRSMHVSSLVSEVAAIPQVRHALVALQQQFGQEKGIVMDGRDIGTTVFPQAELKLFVKASAQTRAQRRLDELIAKGQPASFEEVLANVVHRDTVDQTRKESPLRQAPDAIVIENDNLTPEQQNALLLDLFNQRIAQA